jgi:esterase/lipase
MKLYRMSSDNKSFLFLDTAENVCKVYQLLDSEAAQESSGLGLSLGGLFGGGASKKKGKRANFVFRERYAIDLLKLQLFKEYFGSDDLTGRAAEVIELMEKTVNRKISQSGVVTLTLN